LGSDSVKELPVLELPALGLVLFKVLFPFHHLFNERKILSNAILKTTYLLIA